MTDSADLFIRQSSHLLTADYLPKIARAVGPLGEELVWQRPNDASNSVGNLLLHLRGNVGQWIIGGVAGRPNLRRRSEEFAERGPLPVKTLMETLTAVVEDACGIIAALDADELVKPRQIQGYEVTVLEAVYHVVEHFGMHTGQIMLLSKLFTGRDLQLWQAP